eukprot:4966594-Pyramimonas_sp.AAC.1
MSRTRPISEQRNIKKLSGGVPRRSDQIMKISMNHRTIVCIRAGSRRDERKLQTNRGTDQHQTRQPPPPPE